MSVPEFNLFNGKTQTCLFRFIKGKRYAHVVGIHAQQPPDYRSVGTVTFAGRSGAYGNVVKIRHSNGIVTLYAHMEDIDVSVGQRVSRGQQIGTVGNTGRSTGPHLHFEVIRNGVRVDPAPYFNKNDYYYY